jgi:hypothetical protein
LIVLAARTAGEKTEPMAIAAPVAADALMKVRRLYRSEPDFRGI